MRCQENSAQLIQFHEHEVVEMLRDPSQLQLVFQPQVNLKTGRIESAEALARWNHPVWGVLPAGRFIGGILGLGLQGPLFRRVAELALAASAALTLAGKPLPLAINACAATLSTQENIEFLRSTALRRRVAPALVKVELTEDAPVTDIKALKAAVSRLRQCGFKVSIDDFGVGYANLDLLLDLDIDELKLDRVFAAQIGDNPIARQSVRFALCLAKEMGWRVVAEGISTETELRALYQLGCRHGQGYYLGRPMSLEALLTLPRDRRCQRGHLPGESNGLGAAASSV
ncbi:EAL domain-containing protein [Achromobacter insolitus]|uniref:EAL domain-containing protein n=1 Tax=Achromobacter insolitus TaxID=217204 RepID=UPI00241F4500|nr:EAL domain-containing protein [Achromobacter insolitus]